MTVAAPGTGTISPTEALETYRTMRTIRAFEERLHLAYATDRLPGVAHLYVGQEAVAAGTIGLLRDDDTIASTHRGHGHAIAKGCDLTAMYEEILGRAGGSCGGKGGSMHVADFARGMLGANGVAAGGVPIACGAALTAKTLGTGGVALAFVGDGGVNQGVFAESLTLAAVWALPVVFVVEDNGYAQSTGSPFHLMGVDAARRAEGYGIAGVGVDGTDVLAVRAAAGPAIERARAGGGPTVLSCRAVRWFGHMEGWDAQGYRDPEEVDRLRAGADPVAGFTARMTAAGLLEADQLARADAEIDERVEQAYADAAAAPFPEPSRLYEDVFATATGKERSA